MEQIVTTVRQQHGDYSRSVCGEQQEDMKRLDQA